MVTFTSWRSFLTRLAGSDSRTRAGALPRPPPGRRQPRCRCPVRPRAPGCRCGCPGRRERRRRWSPWRQETRPIARQTDQGDQSGHGHDHDQTDPKFTHRRPSVHPAPLPGDGSIRAIVLISPAVSRAGRGQQRRAVKGDRVINQHEPARVRDQNGHERETSGSKHRRGKRGRHP